MTDKPIPKTFTAIAVVAFGVVTMAMLGPGLFKSATAKPPEQADFYVAQAFERRTRVFDASGMFQRLPSGAVFGEVTAFTCARSAAARREYGWRGGREILFDCPATFADSQGRVYAWVFRLTPDADPIAETSPEGYRTAHIDATDARALLTEAGWMP